MHCEIWRVRYCPYLVVERALLRIDREYQVRRVGRDQVACEFRPEFQEAVLDDSARLVLNVWHRRPIIPPVPKLCRFALLSYFVGLDPLSNDG